MKKICVVDDSALMRRVLCDIINSDSRFSVTDTATNGMEALRLLEKNQYDAMVLDVNMPQMNGIDFLKEVKARGIKTRIMMASTDTREGAQVTMESLELGAIDFIHKPNSALDCRIDAFKETFLATLAAVADSKEVAQQDALAKRVDKDTMDKLVALAQKHVITNAGSKIVAIASSTGGPKALQSVIPKLPANLDAPVVLVQHMPVGFTSSLAERLNTLSAVEVKEAAEGDVLKKGCVYISKGGLHMNVVRKGTECVIHYTDEPNREGVKPCANYMFESLIQTPYEHITCVVMTGMGADGTAGVTNLKKGGKKIHVIAQEESTCVVYGMPKCIVQAGLNNQIAPLEQLAQEITLNVGVK